MVLLGFTEVLASLVADRTVLVSPQTRRWTPWVSTVIPNGVETHRFAPAVPQAKHPDPTILFVGTWHGRKRGAELATIFAERVRGRIPAARLRMVTQDAPASVPDRITVLGRLDDDALAEEYRRAWVFCLPSSYEGFGIPYAEAMAAGLPVVATPNHGARYVTDEGRFGVLRDIDSIDQPLVDLLTDAGERIRMSGVSLARAQEFDLAVVADQYESVYRSRRQQRSKPSTKRSPER